MIAALRGTVISKTTNRIIIDVNGVGYDVAVSLSCLENLALQQEAFLYVHTSVRETAFELFGFSGLEEKALFEMLITIAGIGPKTALAAVSGVSPGVFREAVLSGNSAKLTGLPGIGKKTADRIVLELKEKLRRLPTTERPENVQGGSAGFEADLVSSLVNLGYKERVAEQVTARTLREASAGITLAAAIKAALKELMD